MKLILLLGCSPWQTASELKWNWNDTQTGLSSKMIKSACTIKRISVFRDSSVSPGTHLNFASNIQCTFTSPCHQTKRLVQCFYIVCRNTHDICLKIIYNDRFSEMSTILILSLVNSHTGSWRHKKMELYISTPSDTIMDYTVYTILNNNLYKIKPILIFSISICPFQFIVQQVALMQPVLVVASELRRNV
ncbi:hypothetical protein V1477_001538 [Vespula maculifrons]|uniref:Uncharacterized protein n=1 Tax=Vespula maculifrons TaxID=7453 RepID=A0ABD2CYN2_VESMC